MFGTPVILLSCAMLCYAMPYYAMLCHKVYMCVAEHLYVCCS